MRRLRLLAMLFLSLLASPGWAGLPYAEYGPACQWLRLRGEWERPPGMAPGEPLLLTITYLLPGQKTPVNLVVNYPVWKQGFRFVLSSLDQRIEGVNFVPPEFFFAEEAKFQYYGSSPDRRWKSEWKQAVYRPQWSASNGEVRCHTLVPLEPLRLEPR